MFVELTTNKQTKTTDIKSANNLHFIDNKYVRMHELDTVNILKIKSNFVISTNYLAVTVNLNKSLGNPVERNHTYAIDMLNDINKARPYKIKMLIDRTATCKD